MNKTRKARKPLSRTAKIVIVVVLVIIGFGYPIFFIPVALMVIFKIYETWYFRSDKFQQIKDRIAKHVADCNDLNAHIEDLKKTTIGDQQLDYGSANVNDTSKWNFQRKEYNKYKFGPNVYNCSRTVCDNARQRPLKYVCKYFGIKENQESLEKVETMLNNFEAVEHGKKDLENERAEIINDVRDELPWVIKTFTTEKKLASKLSFTPVDLDTMYFPRYLFQYVSSGGNASLECEVVLDIENLNRFVEYLGERVKWKKSVAGQRALMTSRLRQHILERDHFTCKKCGASTSEEPNLLLEVDHIIPISKGGMTSEENLQTLCWRCNRSKGAKIE